MIVFNFREKKSSFVSDAKSVSPHKLDSVMETFIVASDTVNKTLEPFSRKLPSNFVTVYLQKHFRNPDIKIFKHTKWQ